MRTQHQQLSRVSASALLAVLLAGMAAADSPHIGYVYPAGGRQGTTFEVTVGGQFLRGTRAGLVSGDGVKVRVGRYATPLSDNSMKAAQDKLREVGRFKSDGRNAMEEGEDQRSAHMNMLAARAADQFEMYAAKLGLDDTTPRGFARYQRIYNSPRRQPNAQISETVILEITVAPDAVPGARELRLQTSAGVTNPIVLQIGQVREYREHEPNDLKPDNGALSMTVDDVKLTYTMDDLELPNLEQLPVVLNGQIMPGDVDRFKFQVPKGMRLVAAVSARSIVPYLADAVPGWFQATLALLDPKGNEVAYADDFRFDPDPVVCYEIPETGEYTLEIKDSIYRGREDFVYRILVGEEPYLTNIFPLGGRVGAETRVAVSGWNLPAPEVTVDGGSGGAGIRHVSMSKDGRVSNRLPFVLDTLPQQLEAEPNNACARAEDVTLPVIVNGRMDEPGDWDVFRLQGRAGNEITVEVQARRLRSPMDSVLKITDADGKILAANDDFLDKAGHLHRGPGLITHHADSLLRFEFPADGQYFLHIGDTQRQGGPAHAYRLRISPRVPDFDLRVVPSSISAQAGQIVPITVYALRRDGFAGEISLALTDAKSGFGLGGGWIPAGQDKVRLTLTAPGVQRNKRFELQLEGRATIDGREVCRPAAPADDTMQAFLWRHLVATNDWTATIRGGGRGVAAPARILNQGAVQIPTDGDVTVKALLRHGTANEQLKVDLMDPPEGVAVKEVTADSGQVSIVLVADAKAATAGLQGNLIVEVYTERERKAKDGRELPKQRVSLGRLPAIPFEIASK